MRASGPEVDDAILGLELATYGDLCCVSTLCQGEVREQIMGVENGR